MNILWSNAGLWPGLALIAVPLLLHLFARLRPRPYRFPSAEFLHRVVRRTSRMKRPHDLWLLLVRTLLMAAIVLLFLKPVLHLRRRAEADTVGRNVVIIVDATASMGWVEGARTRFAAACAEAAEALGGLTGRDQANVIWLRARPVSVFPALGRNIAYLRQALRRAGVTYEAGDIPAAFQLAAHMLEGTEGAREIHIISDFQRSTWEFVELPDLDVEWIRIPVGHTPAVNTAIAGVVSDPPQPLAGEAFTMSVQVRHFGNAPRRLQAYLTMGEIHRSREVILPAWGEATVIFDERLVESGRYPFEIRLDEDGFAADDQYIGEITVRDGLRVGLLANDEDLAGPWRDVLEALGWTRRVPLREPDLRRAPDVDVLMLAGWDGRGDGVYDFLKGGGSVIMSPARGQAFHGWNRLAGNADSGGGLDPVWEENRRQPWSVRLAMPDDGLFRVFEGGAFGDPTRADFSARFRLPRSMPGVAAAQVLMEYNDRIPALMRWRMPGTLYLWNLPLGRETTAWTMHEEFVVLVGELVLAGRPAAASAPDRMPGDRLDWRPGREVVETDIHVVTPDGESRAVTLRRDAGDAVASAGYAERPGRYTWRVRDRDVASFAVNFPVIESDLRTLSPSELRSGRGLTVAGGYTVRRLRDGIPLWPYLLVAAVMLAVIESWATWGSSVFINRTKARTS